MRRRDVAIAAIAALAACAPRAQGPAENDLAPGELVRWHYEGLVPLSPRASLFRDNVPPLWSAAFGAKLTALRANAHPILTRDPLTAPYRLRDFYLYTVSVERRRRGVVRARFSSAGGPGESLYDLIWEGGGWRIDNIRGEGWNFADIVVNG